MSAAQNRAERAKLRSAMLAVGEPLRFMDREFASVTELRAEYPAFASDDAIRAMRAGCTTVQEIETFCWKFRNRAHLKNVQAAQRSRFAARHAMGPRA